MGTIATTPKPARSAKVLCAYGTLLHDRGVVQIAHIALGCVDLYVFELCMHERHVWNCYEDQFLP